MTNEYITKMRFLKKWGMLSNKEIDDHNAIPGWKWEPDVKHIKDSNVKYIKDSNGNIFKIPNMGTKTKPETKPEPIKKDNNYYSPAAIITRAREAQEKAAKEAK